MSYFRKRLRDALLVALLFCLPHPALAGFRIAIGSTVTIGQTLKLDGSGDAIPTTAATDHIIGVARTGSNVVGTLIDVYDAGEVPCDCLAGAVAGEWLAVSGTAGSGDAGSATAPDNATLIGMVEVARDGSGECLTILTNLAPHIPRSGANIANTPAGDIAATDVQAAIDELDTEKSASAHVHAAADITSGTLAHERGGLEVDASAFNGLNRISGGTTTNVTDLAGLNTALGSSVADGAHRTVEEEQDAATALWTDAQSDQVGARITEDDANDALDIRTTADETVRTFHTTVAVTEGTTVVNLTNPSVSINGIASCECNEFDVTHITVTPTGGGTDVDMTWYDDDAKTTAVATWEEWDASAASLVDEGPFRYTDADNTQEIHLTIDAIAGGPGTYTITIKGGCVAGGWICP